MLFLGISRLLLVSVLIIPAFAQLPQYVGIHSLATTGDGSVVFFAGNLRLAGTGVPGLGRIFKWDGALSVVPGSSITAKSSTAAPFGPVTSDTGAVTGYSFPCFATCGTYTYNGQQVNGGGTVYVSRNGRWGLRGVGGPKGSDAFRLEFSTGELSERISSVWGITNAGELLSQRGNSLYLGQPGQEGRLVANAPGRILDAVLDANGSRVVYVSQHDGLIELREGTAVLASLADDGSRIRVELSGDGSRMLVVESILDTSRAYWIQGNQAGQKELGGVREGSATISSDGHIVWLVEEDGRLTKVRLETGEREAVTEPFPARLTSSGTGVRGSMIRISGPGLGEGPWRVTLTPQPGLSESMDLPIIETKSDHVDFQLPWNLDPAYQSSWLDLGRPDGILQARVGLFASPRPSPEFWSEADVTTPEGRRVPVIKAVHEAYDRMVTPDDPARPGELVHIYMSGLGSVSPIQADNVPAPSPPPSITSPFACTFPQNVSARVRFAGLADGMTGVYLVELEIPKAPISAPLLTCSLALPQNTVEVSGYLPVF